MIQPSACANCRISYGCFVHKCSPCPLVKSCTAQVCRVELQAPSTAPSPLYHNPPTWHKVDTKSSPQLNGLTSILCCTSLPQCKPQTEHCAIHCTIPYCTATHCTTTHCTLYNYTLYTVQLHTVHYTTVHFTAAHYILCSRTLYNSTMYTAQPHTVKCTATHFTSAHCTVVGP